MLGSVSGVRSVDASQQKIRLSKAVRLLQHERERAPSASVSTLSKKNTALMKKLRNHGYMRAAATIVPMYEPILCIL
jgi:hypothetical protein